MCSDETFHEQQQNANSGGKFTRIDQISESKQTNCVSRPAERGKARTKDLRNHVKNSPDWSVEGGNTEGVPFDRDPAPELKND
jgi:hypothetical protein